MAWPSTPLTTYTANTAPAIKAFDLNAFQSGINGIINGTYSLKALVVDGTGGSIVAPTANTLQIGTGAVVTLDGGKIAFTGVVNPSATTSIKNQVLPLSAVKAWGFFQTDGAGNISRTDGIGFGNPVFSGTLMRFPFTDAMATAQYGVWAFGYDSSDAQGNTTYQSYPPNNTVNYVEISAAPTDPTTNIIFINVIVLGRQS